MVRILRSDAHESETNPPSSQGRLNLYVQPSFTQLIELPRRADMAEHRFYPARHADICGSRCHVSNLVARDQPDDQR